MSALIKVAKARERVSKVASTPGFGILAVRSTRHKAPPLLPCGRLCLECVRWRGSWPIRSRHSRAMPGPQAMVSAAVRTCLQLPPCSAPTLVWARFRSSGPACAGGSGFIVGWAFRAADECLTHVLLLMNSVSPPPTCDGLVRSACPATRTRTTLVARRRCL